MILKNTLKVNFLILLIAVGFLIAFSLISNAFDGDFGWHLRFGKDAVGGDFQYRDSYTWSHEGREWVNHEWGGDILFWVVYSNFGYWALVFLTAAALWAAFVIAPAIFFRLGPASLAVSLLCLLAAKFVPVMRLSMFAPLFFVLLWWSLEKKKYFYLWPVLFWLWSALHGSWILGFILINIYIVGVILSEGRLWRPKSKNPLTHEGPRDSSLHFITLGMTYQVVSAAAICLNPYGIKIWREVINYFLYSDYKSLITEWLPSYTYPVYWWPLVTAAVCAVLLFIGWRKRMVSWPQILLFAFIFLSAWLYKRNNLFLTLVCAPILFGALKSVVIPAKAGIQTVANGFRLAGRNDRLFRMASLGMTVAIFAVAAFVYLPGLRLTKDVWSDRELLALNGFPVEAVEFLDKNIAAGDKIFNEFSWGGYLNWTLPEATVYLDGRGAATWRDEDGEFLLKKYLSFVTGEGGLARLEQTPARFVLLEKNRNPYPPPSWTDKIIFNKKNLEMITSREPSRMEKDLLANKNWKLVHTDAISNVWERTGFPPSRE